MVAEAEAEAAAAPLVPGWSAGGTGGKRGNGANPLMRTHRSTAVLVCS
jgi:hypothetical protein